MSAKIEERIDTIAQPNLIVENWADRMSNRPLEYTNRVLVVRGGHVPAGTLLLEEQPIAQVSRFNISQKKINGMPAKMIAQFCGPTTLKAVNIKEYDTTSELAEALRFMETASDELKAKIPDWMKSASVEKAKRLYDWRKVEWKARQLTSGVQGKKKKKAAKSRLEKLAAVFLVNGMRTLTAICGLCFGRALYKIASAANHSCQANTGVVFGAGQSVQLRALRRIEDGEEVTISYTQRPAVQFCGAVGTPTSLPFTCVCKYCRETKRARGPQAIKFGRATGVLTREVDLFCDMFNRSVAVGTIAARREELSKQRTALRCLMSPKINARKIVSAQENGALRATQILQSVALSVESTLSGFPQDGMDAIDLAHCAAEFGCDVVARLPEDQPKSSVMLYVYWSVLVGLGADWMSLDSLREQCGGTLCEEKEKAYISTAEELRKTCVQLIDVCSEVYGTGVEASTASVIQMLGLTQMREKYALMLCRINEI